MDRGSWHCTGSSNQDQFSSVQSLSRVRLFATAWIAACQASLSITISRSSLRLTVHRVRDTIQPSHPGSSPSPAPNPSQHQSLFQWVSSSHEVAKAQRKFFFLIQFYRVGLQIIFSINIREGFMWQQLLSHSWNHVFSEAQCLGLLHCTLGGVVEDNMLDFFMTSLALLVPGHAVWDHPF